MHRAACMIREGDIDAGVAHAAGTLTSLPRYARGQFVLTVADAVLARVPESERRRSDVAEYRHVLAAARGGQPTEDPDA